PENVMYGALQRHAAGQSEKRTVRIYAETNRFERCEDSPDLSSFYKPFRWSKDELEMLIEAAKLNEVARRRNRAEEPADATDDDEDRAEDQPTPAYTSATVTFLKELPSHVADPKWHEANKVRYQNVLRDPTQRLVEMLRSQFVGRLSPEVAG